MMSNSHDIYGSNRLTYGAAIKRSLSREEYAERFSNYKREAIRAAKDLLYKKDVIKKLENAGSESEIEHIMCSARKERYRNKY